MSVSIPIMSSPSSLIGAVLVVVVSSATCTTAATGTADVGSRLGFVVGGRQLYGSRSRPWREPEAAISSWAGLKNPTRASPVCSRRLAAKEDEEEGFLGGFQLPNFGSLFGGDDEDDSTAAASAPSPLVPPIVLSDRTDPEALLAKVKFFVDTDLGLISDVLYANDDDFIWIPPDVFATGPLSKAEYLAAGRFFDLRATFPDLDYRAYDYRLDSRDARTVRLTTRLTGTMRGPLRLRSEVLEPNGKRMICPPEAISLTFNEEGKVVKLVTGVCMDRLIGNTEGLVGVKGAAAFAGAKPDAFEIKPVEQVVSEFVGRPLPYRLDDERESYLSPFPESVMLTLAKTIISADGGAKEPQLLSPEYLCYGPTTGPFTKTRFVEVFQQFDLREAVPDLDSEISNMRIDPYDPYRVWADLRVRGNPTAERVAKGSVDSIDGAPEAISVTLDDNGFCTRFTVGAILDPTQGNTGGFGGGLGVLYATKSPLPPWISRPIPQLLARAQKALLKPFTGIDVDDYVTRPGQKSKKKASPEAEEEEVEEDEEEEEEEEEEVAVAPKLPPKPAVKAKPAPTPPRVGPRVSAPTPKLKAPQPVAQKVDPSAAKSQAQALLAERKAAAEAKRAKAREEKEARIAASIQARQEKAAQAQKQAKAKADQLKAKREQEAARLRKLVENQKAQTTAAQRAAKQKDAQLLKLAQVNERRKAETAEKLRKQKEEEGRLQKQRAQSAMAAAAKKAEKEAAAEARRAKAEEAAAAKRAKQEAQAAAAAKKAEEAAAAAQAKREAAAAALRAKMEEKNAREQATAAAARKAKEEEAAAAKRAKEQAAAAAKQEKDELIAAAKKAKEEAAAAAKKAKEEAAAAAKKAKEEAAAAARKAKEEAAAKKAPKKLEAPAGVPTISRWKKERDGSITGIISGSPAFSDGSRVTTSPIANGVIARGNVVTTASGSRYFLS